MKTLFNTYLTIIFLLVILVSAALLRLYQIGSVPPSPDWDEAALGYNAYSILITGRDEYGKLLPVVLESFDDYKPALYAYFVIPFIPVMGLTVEAVRMPAAIFGILSILGLFFVVRLLFSDGLTYGKIHLQKNVISLLSAFLLAISPWHIQFSRVAFEAQVGLAINIFAILFFLKAFKKNYFLPISFALAAISIYVYQSEKVYIPLLFLILVTAFYKNFIKISRKWIFSSFAVGLLLVMPMLFFIVTNPNALNRAKGVSVFADSTKLLFANSEKIERDRNYNNYIGLLFDNRRVEYGKAFLAGYLSHFDPNWLFYEGDTPRHHAPYMGLLYLFELPFILIGIYILIFSNVKKQIKYFIFGYVLIAPLPAAVTIDVPHAVRTINMLPAPQIFAAIGLFYFVMYVSRFKKIVKYPIFFICTLVIIANIVYYLNQYFVQQNYYFSKEWQYGWKEAVERTNLRADDFDRVIVSNVSPLDQSYIFYLFYMKYDPKKYLAAGGTKRAGYADSHTAFEKFEFRPINWSDDQKLKNTMFVGRLEDLPVNRGILIKYLNGEPAIVFSETNE